MSTGERIFRLLIRAVEADGAADTLVLGGVKWKLGEWRGLAEEGESLDYTCISYSWGSAFVPHALDPGRKMSARAVRVAETVIAAVAPSSIWIDAYCVPESDPERKECIRRLAAIYGGASQVVAVLTSPWAPALERFASGDCNMSFEADPLEPDDWVARVWTYQEILNSQDMRFTAEGTRVSLSAIELLSSVGGLMFESERALGIDSFALKRLYPRLDALQDLLGDFQMHERPVFQLISGMGTRDSVCADDRYDAMIGIVDRMSVDRTLNEAPLPAVEALLRACDAKGDFSYVYTVAPRCKVEGRSWRPAPEGPLRAPMMWHCFGDGQCGTPTATHLRLENVAVRRHGPVGDGAKAFISGWLGIDVASFEARDAGARTYRRLQDAGFDGAAQAIDCDGGFLFAQSAHVDAASLMIVTPRNLRWVHGTPALVLERGPDGVARYRDVGVFVGPPPAADAFESIGVS